MNVNAREKIADHIHFIDSRWQTLPQSRFFVVRGQDLAG